MRSPAPRRMREKTAPVTAAMDAPPMSGLVRSRLSLQGGVGRGRRTLLEVTDDASAAGGAGTGRWSSVQHATGPYSREAAATATRGW